MSVFMSTEKHTHDVRHIVMVLFLHTDEPAISRTTVV